MYNLYKGTVVGVCGAQAVFPRRAHARTVCVPKEDPERSEMATLNETRENNRAIRAVAE